MTTQEAVNSAERLALRGKNELRPVQDKEEGASILRLPPGVYGFTNSPTSEELPVFTQATFRSYEVQKLKDGSVQFAGYVTTGELGEFEKGTEAVALNLYPEPTGESTVLITVPLYRIDRRRAPSRDKGNWMPVDVSPL